MEKEEHLIKHLIKQKENKKKIKLLWNPCKHWGFFLKLQTKGQANGYQTLFCGLSSFISLSPENLNVIRKCWQLTKYVPITFDETALGIFQVIFYLYWIICYIFHKEAILLLTGKAAVTVLKYYPGYRIFWNLSLEQFSLSHGSQLWNI